MCHKICKKYPVSICKIRHGFCYVCIQHNPMHKILLEREERGIQRDTQLLVKDSYLICYWSIYHRQSNMSRLLKGYQKRSYLGPQNNFLKYYIYFVQSYNHKLVLLRSVLLSMCAIDMIKQTNKNDNLGSIQLKIYASIFLSVCT